MQELGLIKSLKKDLTIWRPVLPVFLKHRVPHFWFSPWTPFRAVESQQLQWPWFNLCRCRWQVSIFSWQSPFLLSNLTMILRGAFHDHFIPWCWESILRFGKDFVDSPLNVLLLDEAIKQYPKFSGPPVLLASWSRKTFPLVALSRI